MPADEAARFLTDSPDRQRLLRHLVESSGSPAEFADTLPLSRRSVQRHLRQFAERGWVRKTDGHYELTVTGELVIEEHERYLDTLGRIDDLAEFFSHLPNREHTPDPRWLDTATVAKASPENPQAPVQHYLEQVRSFETDHIRMISPVLSRLFQKAHAELALKGVHTDLVMDTKTVDRAKELNPKEFDITSSVDVLDIYRHPDDIAFGLTIGESRVLMGAYDDDGQLADGCLRRRRSAPAENFLRELKDRHNVEDAEFLVDGMGVEKHRGRDPAENFLRELKDRHNVEDAEFLVDGMGYLTALARVDLNGHLDYTDRNIVEKPLVE